jgi:hypothetical protein
MKYEVTSRGARLEATGAHSGYRIRMSTADPHGPGNWPLHVFVRGSESEDEVAVPVPRHALRSRDEAFDLGYEMAVLFIDALDHRL